MLHDSLGSVEQWGDFPRDVAIRTNRRVIAYDRVGLGHSSARTEPHTANFIDEDAAEVFPFLVKALGIDRCVRFGHSVGGAMALAAAALNPDMVEAVIIAAAQALVEDRTITGIKVAKIAFHNSDRFEMLKKWHGVKAAWVLNAWTKVWLSPEFALWSLEPYLNKGRLPGP